MKGFRSTGILFVLVALLAGYTFYEFKHADEDAASERGEVPAFSLKRENVEKIKLTHQEVEIELRKDGDSWKMIKPVEDLAESSMVDGFMISTLPEKLKSFRSADDGKEIKWAEYGLDPAPTQVEFSGKGKSETLKVSGKTAYDGSYYVRKGDELLLGSSPLSQLSTRQPSSFRSRKLWREPETTSVESIAVSLNENSKLSYKLIKEGGKWAMDPKPPFALDNAKIEAWVQRVKDLMPNDFASEVMDEPKKREFLLLKPSFQAVLSLKRADGSSGSWQFTAGQDKAEDVYAYTHQRPTIYKFSKQGLAPVRVSADYFRDGKKPFQFDVEKAHEVEIHGDKWHHTLVKADATWKIKGDPKDLELSQDKLIQLFQNVHSLEASEFATTVNGAKLVPRLIIRDGKGGEIFSLAWGEETIPLKPWDQGMKFRWVKTNLEKELMGLPKEKLDMLLSPDIVKKKVEAKTDTKPEKK